MARYNIDKKIKKQIAKIKNQDGQSLIELVIAVAVAGILIGGSASLVAVSLRGNAQNRYFQTATLLSQDELEKVTTLTERNWATLYNLIKAAQYVATSTAAGTQYVALAGPEIVTIGGVDYTRYFIVENVTRSNCGTVDIPGNPPSQSPCPVNDLQTANAEDPSTQKITATVSWGGSTPGTMSLVKYLTRYRNQVLRQTDWSGGRIGPLPPCAFPLPTAEFAFGTTTNSFACATNIDSGTPGEIKVSTP